MARWVALPDRAVIAVSGEDSLEFLQGLITNDATRVTSERALYAALLTPQGKYLFDFFIFQWRGALCLDCEATRVDALIKRLSMYKLRAKVKIEKVEPAAVFAIFGDDARDTMIQGEDRIAFEDPRATALGVRLVSDGAEPHGIARAEFSDYERLRILTGAPDGSRDLTPEKSFLLDYGFEALNGVDFEKGCYVGQEVTARMKHRNLVKKRLVPVTIDGDAPAPGTPVLRDGAEVGEMHSSTPDEGLALLRLEATDDAEDLTAGSARLALAPPMG